VPGTEHGAAVKKMTGVVNLNTASVEELGTLPGVGPKTAAAILAYRKEHGPFQRVEDLLEIRGIGEKKLTRMRDWIEVK
jgi:competence protein ComEA